MSCPTIYITPYHVWFSFPNPTQAIHFIENSEQNIIKYTKKKDKNCPKNPKHI